MNKWLTICVGIGLIAISFGQASETGKINCFTDKCVYQQGENVLISIRNDTGEDILLTDRKQVDGGFAIIERRHEDRKWRAIELFAAANVAVFKTLKSGAAQQYVWNTIGYNRSDTVAVPGTYRISVYPGLFTNELTVLAREIPK